VDRVLGGQLPDYDSVKSLVYLQAAINETLRMYPPVPADVKYALEDDTLPNGVFVPKGQACFRFKMSC
jgi:fatty acid omega-hydroxylase